MASVAVSRGLSSVFLVGQVVFPVAVDKATNLVLKHLPITPQIPPRIRWTIAIFSTAAAVYLASGIFRLNLASLISGSLYVVYKGRDFINALNEENWENRPMCPGDILKQKWNELSEILTFPDQRGDYRNILNEVRRRWQDPKTIELQSEIMRLAVQEMQGIYDKLKEKAGDLTGQEAHKKMAEELKNLMKEDSYLMFCSRSSSLPSVYRAARGLRFVEKKNESSIIEYLVYREQKEEDSIAFFEEIPQSQWREDSNRIMDLFAPIMVELKQLCKNPDKHIQKWIESCVRDNDDQIFKKDDPRPGVFKL